MKLIKILICILLVLLSTFSISANVFIKDHMYSDETEAALDTLDRFYEAFMTYDIGEASEYIDQQNGQMVINYRFYYGNIKDYEITEVNPRDDLHIEAKVQVSIEAPADGKSVFTDTILLEKIQHEWLITQYDSTSEDYLWPN